MIGVRHHGNEKVKEDNDVEATSPVYNEEEFIKQKHYFEPLRSSYRQINYALSGRKFCEESKNAIQIVFRSIFLCFFDVSFAPF